MVVTYAPLRKYMQENNITYYYLNNQGIDSRTLQRIRHDKTVTTKALAKLATLLNCRPEQMIDFVNE